MTYKISIVKTSDGDYLVNYYHKSEDEKVSSFAELVCRIFDYSQNIEIFKEEPVLRGLSEREERSIKGIRRLILFNADLSDKALIPDL